MKLLLDTHVFLWYINADKRLPISLQGIIRDSENRVYLSVVSLWEAIIKYQLGKLPLPQPPEIYLPVQREHHLIASLPLDEVSVTQLAHVPLLHRDPFDRMLISQALHNDLIIVTLDALIQAYPVKVLTSL